MIGWIAIAGVVGPIAALLLAEQYHEFRRLFGPRLWILIHEHRHGVDVFPKLVAAGDRPSDEESVMAAIIAEGGSEWEPARRESAEWRGPFTTSLTMPKSFTKRGGQS